MRKTDKCMAAQNAKATKFTSSIERKGFLFIFVTFKKKTVGCRHSDLDRDSIFEFSHLDNGPYIYNTLKLHDENELHVHSALPQ